MMFGPPDNGSPLLAAIPSAGRSSASSNDELRQKFVDFTVPQGEVLRAELARSAVAVERRRINGMISDRSIGASSNRVLKGNGPCNAETSGGAPERPMKEGAWVSAKRPMAYARKQRVRKRKGRCFERAGPNDHGRARRLIRSPYGR